MKDTLRFPIYAKISLIIIGLFAFTEILFITQSIILPIIYSVIIAILLNPVINFFVNKKINRVLVISVTLVLALALTFLIITLLSIQIGKLSDSFPKFLVKFNQLIGVCTTWVSENFDISKDKINLFITQKRTEIVKESSNAIAKTLLNTGNSLVVLLLIPVYIFLILFYKSHLLNFIHQVFNKTEFSKVDDVLISTKQIIQSYLIGLLLEACIVAFLNSTALLIIGIEYAILLGVMGAILNLIPYIGGLIAISLPLLIALATKPLTYGMYVLAAYILIQLIDNNFIIPKIVASKVKINALISIVIVLVGGALWGVAGMFLALPLTAIIKIICDHIEPLKPWGVLLGNPDENSKPWFIKQKVKN